MDLPKKDTPETVRVAILSDTHGVLHPQIEALVRDCDLAIHAGDIFDGRILDRLQPKTGRVVAVAGNNDHEGVWPEDQHDRVRALPEIAELELPGGIIRVEHGHRHSWKSPSHDDLRAAHPDARVIVYGHTHKKVIDDYRQPWVINPGAAGATRTRGGPSCMILHAAADLWRIDSYRFSDQATRLEAVSAA